ncbi:MAG: glutathione S-transferase [Inquilinus sp.]|nr:glutathione S-transferase [Inquilinus sp.]
MTVLDLADCINETCPWSGKPVAADSLTTYRGRVVGFCNPGCREKFDKAIGQFDAVPERHGAGREPAS